jgi:ATP-dependent DNA helicase RecQ
MNTDGGISGASALTAVIRQWRDKTHPMQVLSEPPFARLSAALADPMSSDLDRLILLRHVLRYESLRRAQGVQVRLPGGSGHEARAVGLTAHELGPDDVEVAALPWYPDWLEEGQRAVDARAMRADEQRFRGEDGPPADPSLRSLGRETYRSTAQQAAIRAAMSMPCGASLIVDLPTGEGKSTVFQILAAVGFAASPSGQVPGLVVVVVPTVTLALDHERMCRGSDSEPLAYIGGRETRNDAIRRAIASGQQRLVFAAPEAVVKSLRVPLANSAREGRLAAVVIDEAHLIDGWGTGFRTEFQTLAGVLNAWRNDSPAHSAYRTIFLSATFDESSMQVLEDLFSPDRAIPVLSGARVRPEPEYWVAAVSDRPTRVARVEEALLRLPRPAILYVTRVSDADWWYGRLIKRGYARVARMHGGTLADEREDILRRWNDGNIDLVVATSAFGLGIDYPHVRTVIHACLPETLNRFYQEVGRGGRDGRSSVSVLIPEVEDEHLARSLSSKKVITIERGLTRWKAMFGHPTAVCEAYPFYRVPLDIPPGYEVHDIDLVGERSTDWNQRTLALMARSGLIRLLGAEVNDAGEGGGVRQFEHVEICDERHLEMSTWRERVEPTRAEIASQATRAFELLKRFAGGRACPARLILSLYGVKGRHVALVCSGCRVCRENPAAKADEGTVPYARAPWALQGELAALLDNIWGPERYAVITYPERAPASRVIRDFADAMRRLDTYGIRIWTEVGEPASWLGEAARKALVGKPWVTQATDTWAPMIWAEGACVIVCAAGAVPSCNILASGALRFPRLVLIPEGCPDPTQPSRELADIAPGPVFGFQPFLNAVLR